MRKLILTFFVIGLSACAKPQYGNPGANQNPISKAGTGSCLTRFQQSGGCVDIKWELWPTEDEVGSFIFTTTDASTGLLTDLSSGLGIKITLWMPSMGHGSSPVIVEMIAPGVYRAKKVFFSMKADWEIRFQIGTDQAVYALVL